MAQTKVKLISDGVIVQGNLHASHGITTAHIGEGSNLYYTDARVGSYLSTNSFATESYVGTQIANLVDSSPSALNTLNELAAALGDDANFSTTVTNSIATKLPLAGGTMTGALTIADSGAADNPLILGSSSQTSYTLQQWQTSSHGTNEAYIIAYGAGHGSQAGNFAIKNIESGGDIFFELAAGVEPLRLTSTGATFASNVTANGIYTAGNSAIIYKAQRDGGAVAGDWSYDDATTDMSLGTSTGHSFSLKTGNTRALTINSSQNATFAGTSNSLVVISRDNMFVDAGQLYIGADDGATDDTFRQAVVSGVYKIESRKSGTWTTRLTINSDGSVYTPNLLEAAGGLAAGDGVAGAPGFKFASDPHTGMYRIGNDVIGFSTGGSTALTLGNDDATFAGTVTAPKIGIPGANASYAFYNNSNSYFNGNVTIDATLLVSGLSNYTGLEVKGSGASRPQIKFSNVNQGILAQIYGTESNSLVTTAPAGLEYQVRNANGAAGDHVFKSYNTAILTLDGGTNNATFAGNVTVNGGQILSPGGVNIALNPNTGIVSVGGSIQCSGAGASTFNGALLVNKSDGAYISLNHNNSLKGYLGIANQVITGGSASDIGLTASNDLVFGSGGTAARMYIKSNGTIGLGKSSPYYAIDATEIGANSHAWGSSGATFGQDHYQIRELNNLLWNAYDRFKDHGTSNNLTYQMFDGNFDSGTALPTNSTHVIEIDFGAQGAMTYPYGFTVISFYYVYNNFTSVSGEQYHAHGTFAGQWRAMGTPVDIRGSAGAGVRVVKIPGGNNNYVTKFRYTFVTGSSSVNVSDICYMTSRPAGYPISAYMRGDRDNNWFRNIYFKNSSFTTIGSIVPGSSSTAYNTSSDYRLKENVVEMTGALDRVSQLKPSRFNFISDADKTVDGFLAHEVQEIIPEAITGEKDAVDEQGNPKLQAIDQSKLVPLLVAAIQELKAEIDELKK